MNDKKKQNYMDQRRKLMRKMRARSQKHDQLLKTSVDIKEKAKKSKSKEQKAAKKRGDEKVLYKLAREEEERLLVEKVVDEKCLYL
jgi:hypothetical protein